MIDKIEKKNCSGCRACEHICSVGSITMKEDEEGFLYPFVDYSTCVNCGKCVKVCENIGKRKLSDVKGAKVFAAKNTDNQCRNKSSSGGVFFEVAKWIIDKGGVVFGAAFAEDFSVKQINVSTEEEISLLMGSKYLQSDTNNTYCTVKKELEEDKWVLYTGTPCQIEGLVVYLGKEYPKLVCMSVICHGVPSPQVWHKYLRLKMGQYAINKVQSVKFRDKTRGWANFGIVIDFGEVLFEASHETDLYMQGFLQDLYLRPSCYQCRSKGIPLSSDFIVGDFWGIDEVFPDFNEDKGISAVIVNSINAEKIWNDIRIKFIEKETTYHAVLKGNKALEESARMNPRRERFFQELHVTHMLEECIKNNIVERIISEESRRQYQYPIIHKYLKKVCDKGGVGEVLNRENIKDVVLYAITDITEIVIRDINRDNKVNIKYICDKNNKKHGEYHNGIKVISIDELVKIYRDEDVKIIICNPMREQSIYEDLLGKGIELERLISVVSLIFD